MKVIVALAILAGILWLAILVARVVLAKMGRPGKWKPVRKSLGNNNVAIRVERTLSREKPVHIDTVPTDDPDYDEKMKRGLKKAEKVARSLNG